MPRFRFTVPDDQNGKRLDQVLADEVPSLSRTRAKAILASGGVFVDRKRVKIAGRQMRAGQSVEVNAPRNQNLRTQGESRKQSPEIRIISQTEDFVVVEKPSGLFSAATPDSDTNDLLYFLSQMLWKEPSHLSLKKLHLVHRLDRPTSGLMVVAKNKAAAAELSAQIARRAVKRIYLAVIAGSLESPVTAELPVHGKNARTTFTPFRTRGGISLVCAELDTGRTHQVRIHAESLGMPVAGDSKYGRQTLRALSSRPPRLALHAHELTFYDPNDGRKLSFQSPFPNELNDWFHSAQLVRT